MLILDTVFGLSDPINQTLSEYNNLTKADNVLEVGLELNVWLGGIFGIVLLLIIFAVLFGMSMYFTQNMGVSLTFSMFITTVTSIFLKVVNFVPDEAVYFCVPIFIISLGYTIISNK